MPHEAQRQAHPRPNSYLAPPAASGPLLTGHCRLYPSAPMMKSLRPLFLVPALLACEDVADQVFPAPLPVRLPAETQAGANTFGCRVNGQVWEANHTRTLAGKVLTPSGSYEHGTLRLNAFRRLQVEGPVTNFAFTLTHVTAPGVYPLALDGNTATLTTATALVGYTPDAEHRGTLTITRLDTTGAQPFVAGRFALRAATRAGAVRPADFPAELVVTDGRFDLALPRR